jgi:methylaspartate ammonia-lyase
MMEQDEVTAYVKEFFQKHGYKVKIPYRRYRPVDVFAEKNGDKWFVEVEAESPKRKTLLQDVEIAIGEIVAEMHEMGPKIHYGIALSEPLSIRLSKFGTEGLKALNLHLFIVTDLGSIYHLNTDGMIEYIKRLRKYSDGLPSTLSTDIADP